MASRFALRYGALGRGVLGPMGLGPRFSWVDVGDADLNVRMGWAFRSTTPRQAVVTALPGPVSWWWGLGVHTNLRRTWVVNGSLGGGVWLEIEPPARGRTLGIPVRVRRLGLTLEDPEEFMRALAVRPRHDPGGSDAARREA